MNKLDALCAVASAEVRGITPLHTACNQADYIAVQDLLFRGEDVNARTSHRETPLHFVASVEPAGHSTLSDIARALIRSGANVHAENEQGQTPLHLASISGNAFLAQVLIEAGAKVSYKDKKGRTPLHRALKYRKNQMISLLCRNKADLDEKDRNGKSCLQLASDSNNTVILTQALRNACAAGDLERVQRYLSENVDLVSTQSRCSPLHLLLAHAHKSKDRYAIATSLLDAGIDVNAQDSRGKTPLHLAIYTNDREMVDLLCSRGADIMLRDHKETSPLSLALDKEMDCIEAMLPSASATPDAFIHAWSAGQGEVAFAALRQWMQCGGQLTTTQAGNFYFLGARMQETELLKLLLSMGYDKNIWDNEGSTPAAHALMHWNLECCALLQPDDYAREYVLRKILSHVCGIDGKSNIGAREFPLDGAYPPIMYIALADALKACPDEAFDGLDAEHKQKLIDVFENAAKKRTPEEILAELAQHQCCLIESGPTDHSLCVLFFQHRGQWYCGICNRTNDSPIDVFAIDPSKLNERIIRILQTAGYSKIDPLHYIYSDLKGELHANENIPAALRDAIQLIYLKGQQHGNCTFASAKAALRLLYLLSTLEEQPETTYPEYAERVRLATKTLTQFVRKHHFDRYLQCSILPDRNLTTAAKASIIRREDAP